MNQPAYMFLVLFILIVPIRLYASAFTTSASKLLMTMLEIDWILYRMTMLLPVKIAMEMTMTGMILMMTLAMIMFLLVMMILIIQRRGRVLRISVAGRE